MIFDHSNFNAVCKDKAVYGFFGRQGGVSGGIYKSLNCGSGSNDDPSAVEENRAIAAGKLGVPDRQISSLWQCHSDICHIISEHVAGGPDRPKADALVTDRPGLAIGVLSADCAPVLFYGEKNDGQPVIGAAHSGWGGALGGVLENTVSKMVECGAVLSTISACIGPCILKMSYEVSNDFAKPFLDRDAHSEHFFQQARKEGRLMFDLPGYVAMRLSAAGLTSVILMETDTYTNENSFFSYRRAVHKGEADYGRQISSIMIAP